MATTAKKKPKAKAAKPETLYDVLGVEPTASEGEIKRAYRRKAAALHPDREGGDQEAMQQLNSAYEVLSNPERRAAYDADGSTEPPRQSEEHHLFLALVDDCVYEDGNIVVNMQRKLHNAMREIKLAAKQGRKTIAKLQARIDKVSGPTPNLIHDVLHAKIADIQQAIKRDQEKFEVMERLHAMTCEYLSSEPVTPEKKQPAHPLEEMLAGLGVFRMG